MFSERGQNKIFLRAALNLFTGGSVPCRSDIASVTHNPASVGLGRVSGKCPTAGYLYHSAKTKKQRGRHEDQCPNGTQSEFQPVGLADGASQHH